MVVDLAQEHGISVPRYYRWKLKYDGVKVSEAKRLRELEAENAKIEKLLVDADGNASNTNPGAMWCENIQMPDQ